VLAEKTIRAIAAKNIEIFFITVFDCVLISKFYMF